MEQKPLSNKDWKPLSDSILAELKRKLRKSTKRTKSE